MRLLSILVASTAILATGQWAPCPSASKMLGIDGLTYGYDIVQGNPSPRDFEGVFGDPGWKVQQIFELTYDDPPSTTADGCFQKPSNVTVQVGGACNYAAEYGSAEDSSSWQLQVNGSLSYDEEASALGGLITKSFSASADFGFYDNETSQSFKSYFYASATCGVYAASFPPMYLDERFQTLHPDFVRAVKLLPADYRVDDYRRFVSYFGTHYAVEVVMGGKMSVMSEFDSQELSDLIEGSFDFKGAVQAEVGVEMAKASAEAAASIGGNAQSYNTYTEKRSTWYKSCVGAGGSCPPSNPSLDTSAGDDNAWVKDVRSNPVPIRYKLNSLDFLFTKTWFPDDGAIQRKSDNLLKFLIDDYCGEVAACSPPHKCNVEEVPSMTLARVGLAAAVFQDKLYAIGGGTSSVEVFDGKSWAPAPSMIAERTNFAAAVFQDKLYAIGGYTSSVEVFDGKSWTPAPSMIAESANFAAAVFQDKLYAFGGDTSSVEVFDGKSWTPAPSMTAARYCPAAAVFQDKLYAIGGSGPIVQKLKSVEVFDGKSWAPAPSMFAARDGLAAAVFQDKLYAFGGFVYDAQYLSSVEVFDGSSYGQYLSSAEVFNRSSYGQFLSSVEVFDGSSWAPAPSMRVARREFAAAVFQDKLYAIGGNGGQFLSSVELFDGTSFHTNTKVCHSTQTVSDVSQFLI